MDRPARPVNLRTRAFGVVAALGLLGGCSENWWAGLPGPDMFDVPRTVRGHAIDDSVLEQVTPGVTTRADVGVLLGTPSASGTFSDSEWYYISGVTRQRPGRQSALENQQVVIVSFDGGGTVQGVRRLGASDGRTIAFVERETESPGNERTLLQRLFGNLGRLGPGVGQTAPTGPGGPSPSGR
jgi:outer membrane protein assembly factor BamE (lipoprotein component of BamABCDE complex)